MPGGFRENAGGWNAKGFFGSIKLDSDTGCWIWQTKSKHPFGYGVISFRGRSRAAHRVAAMLWLGLPTDSKLIVRHKCDNPPCVNPKHLLIGSQQENINDMMDRTGHYKSKRTHCPSGHEYSEQNTYWSRDRKYRRCRTCDNAHRTSKIKEKSNLPHIN